MNPQPETMPAMSDLDMELAQAWKEFEARNPDLPKVHRRRSRGRRGHGRGSKIRDHRCEVVVTSRGTERMRPLPPPSTAMKDALYAAALGVDRRSATTAKGEPSCQ
jgi:hypothetical protein